MKIHKIEISNIASLRGHHIVDFDQIFSESALFAITGKTGSGKSTILNCISLALFGKVYKKDSDGLDFVTLGEAQGKVELTFSNLGHKYLASWKLKLRKKNGDLYKKPQLQRNLGQIQSKNEILHIDKDVEEVIGLTFEQFCKTTILNQGQFAKFLTSNFRERKDILEKFYQGLNLETLNIKLNEKLRQQKALLDESENQIKGHTDAFEHINVTEEAVTILKTEAEEAAKTKTLLDTSFKYFQDIQKSFKTIEENSNRIKFASKQIEEEQSVYNLLKKESDSIQKELKKSTHDLKTEKPRLLEGVKLYNDKQKALEQLEYLTNLKVRTSEQASSFEMKLETTKAQMKEIKSKKNGLIANFEVLTGANIEKLKSDLERFTSQISESIRTKEDIAYMSSQLDTHKVDLAELDAKIQESKNVQGKDTLLNITKDLEQLKKEHQSLSKFIEKKKDFEARFLVLQKDIKITARNEEAKSNSLEKELVKKDELEAHIQNLKKSLDIFSLTQAIHTCLEESKAQGSCVVCGNEKLQDLVKKVNTDQDEINQISQDLEAKTEKLKKLEITVSQIKLEKLALTSQKETLSTELRQVEANHMIEKEQIQSAIKQKDLELPLLINLTKKQESQITKLEDEKVRVLNIESMLNSYKLDHEKLQKRITEISTRLEDYQKKLTLIRDMVINHEKTFKIKQVELEKLERFKKALFDYSTFDEQLRFASKDIDNLTTNIEEKNIQIKNLEQQTTERKFEIEKVNTFLNDNFENLNDPSIRLSKLEDSLQMLQKEALENSKELSVVEVKLAELRSKISGFKEQVTASKLMIESLKEKLSQELQYFTSQNEVEKRETNLITSLSKLDPDEEALDDLLAQLEKLFLQLLESAKNEAKEKQKDYTEKSNDLARKLENEKKVKDLVQKSEAIKENLNKLNNLYELIGKDEFRNFILSLIETTLIEQTNKELESLYQGRYSLKQTYKKNRSMSEFLILDYFRDGMSRKVSTLSGGETFLVSLAMALALAELTRGSTEIDSLFIDEGFGTLDQDSIDEVYELLEKIQHSGKQIGIISHVQSLTSRIGINVNLEKNSLGVSNIDLVYN